MFGKGRTKPVGISSYAILSYLTCQQVKSALSSTDIPLDFAIEKAKEYLHRVADGCAPRLAVLGPKLFSVNISNGLQSPPFKSSSSSEESPKVTVPKGPPRHVLKRGESKVVKTLPKRDPRTKEMRASEFIVSYLPKNYRTQSDVYERYNNVLVNEDFPNGIMEKGEFLSFWKKSYPALVAKTRSSEKRQMPDASPLKSRKRQKAERALDDSDVEDDNNNNGVDLVRC